MAHSVTAAADQNIDPAVGAANPLLAVLGVPSGAAALDTQGQRMHPDTAR